MVKCKICGKEFNHISYTHLKFKHDISIEEYINKYGKTKFSATSGSHTSNKTKQKISEALKGRTISWKDKISKSHLGKKLSKEHKQKISESCLGKKLSEEHKQKISDSLKNHTISEETKEKICLGNKGVIRSEEFKKHLSIINTGKHHTMETRKSIRLTMLNNIRKRLKKGEKLYPGIGFYETGILDNLEKCFNYPITRQFEIDGYFIDGYCEPLRLAIEIDEKYHNEEKQKIKDLERQNYIQQQLRCSFLRIPISDGGKQNGNITPSGNYN